MVLFVLGFGVLVGGAELLVRGASRIAVAAGISPLVIGLTVVSFGTSTPELAVSFQAALSGRGDIALGNVVGSNIFNVLFILGISSIIVPLAVARQLVNLDVPLMIGVSALLLLLGLDGRLGMFDGLLLVAGIVAYTLFTIWQSRQNQAASGATQVAVEAAPRGFRRALTSISMVAVGLGMLALGANWLVGGAVAIARLFGLSELIIGLTIIAAGTSLPEVAASVIAALRGQRDIAVGNVVGSNTFNILAILGISTVVAPGGMAVPPAALAFDIPVMLAVAAACLPLFFSGYTITRWEGWLLLGYYLAYTAFLLLDATRHDALPAFSGVLGLFVLPLTVATLLVRFGRAVRTQGWPWKPERPVANSD